MTITPEYLDAQIESLTKQRDEALFVANKAQGGIDMAVAIKKQLTRPLTPEELGAALRRSQH